MRDDRETWNTLVAFIQFGIVADARERAEQDTAVDWVKTFKMRLAMLEDHGRTNSTLKQTTCS